MKDHIVEIVVIVLAVAILGWFWKTESEKPEPVTPTLDSIQQQAQ